jgi:hypothetical protein
MKSKTPHAFWLRWIGASSVHALVFAARLLLSPNFFLQWQWAFIPINLLSGISLALLQYWAMSPLMRPSPKRWFLASFLGTALSLSLYAVASYNVVPNINNILISKIFLLAPLVLPPAIAQSWVLGERFRKAWLFGLSFCLPALLFLGNTRFANVTDLLPLELGIALLRASLLGASLSYLQKFQAKESSSFDASNERLELQEQEEEFSPEESITEAKFTIASRSTAL